MGLFDWKDPHHPLLFVQGGISTYLFHLSFSSHIDCKWEFVDWVGQQVCPTSKMDPKPSTSCIWTKWSLILWTLNLKFEPKERKKTFFSICDWWKCKTQEEIQDILSIQKIFWWGKINKHFYEDLYGYRERKKMKNIFGMQNA